MGPAVITLAFDPLLRVGGFAVRLETLVLAGVLFAGMVLAAALATGLRTASMARDATRRLRVDDLPFILLGAAVGAVIGGRVDYVLVHAQAFAAEPGTILDPARGSLGLGLAVPGGVLTASYVARFIGAPVRAWWHVAALPLLFVLAAGKLATVLGGGGQGLPSEAAWAIAFSGPGPWNSLGPEIPSLPSQVLEAGAVALSGMLVAVGWLVGPFRRIDGSLLWAAILVWAVDRAIVATTWRDETLVGPLGIEQVVLVVLAFASALAAILVRRLPLDDEAGQKAGHEGGPAWPDPETRPTF
jgi:phosphatidylglycerol:prolipoprotein diacylglycerol transferase